MTGKRAVVYDRFWHSQGGGERHSGMIAEVLSKDGVEVDLLGHSDVDKDVLADHLGLDLSRCRFRVVPDRGDLYLEGLSRDYDLFVNGTYGSRLAPRSAHAAYLCYFPTPFDADLSPVRRALTRTLGPVVRGQSGGVEHGVGWFPPEGGRRRQWAWTSEDAVLTLAPDAKTRRLRLDLGGPGMPERRTLTITDEHDQVITEVEVGPEFTTHHVEFPSDQGGGQELHFKTKTFSPGGSDQRELGVAVSRIRLEGGRHGPRGLLAYRFPWLLRDPRNLSFLSHYDTVMANSEYTRGYISRFWETDADLLFPPIQVQRLHPAPVREKAVITVGRFFSPGLGHAKRQLEMVEFFVRGVRQGTIPSDWRMYVVGGMEDSQRNYVEQVRAAGAGFPVEVIANAPRRRVEELLSTASVFWSATGYGEDERKTPWASEHFGMTTVEAMAAGCVPVVIDRAGQKEIVRENVDGFRWTTPDELLALTAEVATDEALRARLAAAAVTRAQEYSEDAFADRWHAIVDKHHLLG
jgi:glycosyltransferase involved in cell wall biosynthesis